MLPQLSQQNDALYARAVRSSSPTQMRSKVDSADSLTQNETRDVQQQQVKIQRRQAHQEQLQQRETPSATQQNPARVSGEVADKLFADLQKTRQDNSREQTQRRDAARVEHSGQRQKLERTYVADLPLRNSRFVDEIA